MRILLVLSAAKGGRGRGKKKGGTLAAPRPASGWGGLAFYFLRSRPGTQREKGKKGGGRRSRRKLRPGRANRRFLSFFSPRKGEEKKKKRRENSHLLPHALFSHRRKRGGRGRGTTSRFPLRSGRNPFSLLRPIRRKGGEEKKGEGREARRGGFSVPGGRGGGRGRRGGKEGGRCRNSLHFCGRFSSSISLNGKGRNQKGKKRSNWEEGRISSRGVPAYFFLSLCQGIGEKRPVVLRYGTVSLLSQRVLKKGKRGLRRAPGTASGIVSFIPLWALKRGKRQPQGPVRLILLLTGWSKKGEEDKHSSTRTSTFLPEGPPGDGNRSG